MIELSAEQRQAIAQGEPVRIIDPLTQDALVLLRAEDFECLAGISPQPGHHQPSPEISPRMLRSQQAFWQDLPELLKKKRNRGKWVAYHGEQRVALGRTDVDAYQECFRQGLKRGEFYVGKVEADPEGIPPWGRRYSDWSFFEVTEETPPGSLMKILDRLPIPGKRSSLRFGGRFATIHRDQILVWVSIHLAGVLEPEGNISRFPALLDTGNNLAFSIPDRHLRQWAGIDPGLLEALADIEINGQVVGCREATVWLYPNVPGRQDVASGRAPFPLRLRNGIAVYPPDTIAPAPRLPLLGLPALLDNDLDWWLDPERRNIAVQSRTWRRHLMRLLCRL